MLFVFHADFLNLTTIVFSAHLGLPSFAGFCRYGSDHRDWIKDLASTSGSKCLKQCQTTPKCVAFAFTPSGIGRECDLYEGGPYTRGDGSVGSTCYIMQGKTLLLYWYVYYGV